MRFAKAILLAAVAFSMTVYAIDCEAMWTPEQAMQCCDNMPCSSHGDMTNQDCCETMPSMHAPFVQPSAANSVSFSYVAVAVLAAVNFQLVTVSTTFIQANFHAPPDSGALAAAPLRI
jgi:hypothetical protein